MVGDAITVRLAAGGAALRWNASAADASGPVLEVVDQRYTIGAGVQRLDLTNASALIGDFASTEGSFSKRRDAGPLGAAPLPRAWDETLTL